MIYHLGQKSEENLQGVRPGIVKCVRRAIVLTTVDFSVFEGVRARARQLQLYRSGASRTLNSRHLTGDAVDLVPYVEGRLQWQLPLCQQVAIAMREASLEFGVRLRWGAVWDRELSELDPVRLDREINAYIRRYQAARNDDAHPLIDGPHFEAVELDETRAAA